MKLNKQCFLIGSVCLERNRWGSRVPSLAVSDWLPRFKADGFDGVELWQFHYTAVDAAEQGRLEQAASLLPIYNSYVGFDDADAAAVARAEAASIAARLGATGIKFNLGGDRQSLDAYRRNLLAWGSTLPASCQLLCECHPGSVLEKVEDAAVFFADLDPHRFGVIVHVGNATADGVAGWFGALGDRVRHLHVQLRGADLDPATPAGRTALDASFRIVKDHGFDGSVTLEFTRGIGRDENIEALYANACADMRYCREILSC